MKIKLLTSLSGEKTYHAGDEIEVEDSEALALINKNIAEAKNKKEFADLESRIAEAKADDEEKQAQIIAIQKEAELKKEIEVLLENMLAIVTTLNSNDKTFGIAFLEKFNQKWTEIFPNMVKEEDKESKANEKIAAPKTENEEVK